MSEVLNTLNTPEPAQSWEKEVASVAAELPAETPAPEAAPEPVKIEEAAPEPPQPQETASDEQDRRVPLKALQEERQKRAQYEQMLAQREQELAQYQQWAYQQQQQMQPQEPFVEPDPETDPIGALKYAKEQQRAMAAYLEQQAAVQQQEAYVQQISQVAYQAATQMQQQVPDYNEAYRYAIMSRAQELKAFNPHITDQQILQVVKQEELNLIDNSLKNGVNPAGAIYQLAKARGFQGKQAAPQPVAAPDPVMQQAKAAVAASASAGGAPASKGGVSVSDLANLNGAAFDSAWNKLFGGSKSSVFRE